LSKKTLPQNAVLYTPKVVRVSPVLRSDSYRCIGETLTTFEAQKEGLGTSSQLACFRGCPFDESAAEIRSASVNLSPIHTNGFFAAMAGLGLDS